MHLQSSVRVQRPFVRHSKNLRSRRVIRCNASEADKGSPYVCAHQEKQSGMDLCVRSSVPCEKSGSFAGLQTRRSTMQSIAAASLLSITPAILPVTGLLGSCQCHILQSGLAAASLSSLEPLAMTARLHAPPACTVDLIAW